MLNESINLFKLRTLILDKTCCQLSVQQSKTSCQRLLAYREEQYFNEPMSTLLMTFCQIVVQIRGEQALKMWGGKDPEKVVERNKGVNVHGKAMSRANISCSIDKKSICVVFVLLIVFSNFWLFEA